MLEVFAPDMRRVAILAKVLEVTHNQRINSIWRMTFKLSADDIKNEYCVPFNYVRHDGGELYRILPVTSTLSEQSFNVYECEHVLATLIDDPLVGWHQVGNLGYYTPQVINYILQHQEQNNWKLGECDFNHQYEYGWDKENLASALFSIPLPFTARYMWVTDTTVYPWKISLKRLDMDALPKHYLRTGNNIFAITRRSDPTKIATRIFAYGAGEGINQLRIPDSRASGTVNGVPYLQANSEAVKKYGIKVLQWSDRRYTNADSLCDAAQTIIDELSVPYVEYSVENVNVGANIGDMVKVIDVRRNIEYTNIVVEVARTYGEIATERLNIANKPSDIASTISDLADRQRIEQNYSQGATQHYATVYSDNADGSNPTEMYFFIPENMLMINEVQLKIKLNRFRAYSKATQTGGAVTSSSSGGATVTSTSSGGGETTGSGGSTVTTTGGGGGANTSTQSGGGTTTTAGLAINVQYDTGTTQARGADINGNTYGASTGTAHVHGMIHSHNYTYVLTHGHNVSLPNHQHGFTLSDHTHSVTLQAHTHSTTAHTHGINIQAHTHTVDTKHTHDITPVIQSFGSATGFAILVNGVQKHVVNGMDYEGEISDWLVRDGRIPRGTWHTIGIRPMGGDTLARPHMSLHLAGYVQSRGDKTV